jgi:hypothetical protein
VGLAGVIRSGVAAANAATADAQVDVTWEAWIGPDGGFGKQAYAPAVSLKALVTMNPSITRSSAGQVPNILASVTFLDPVPPNGAAGRKEPIDTRDVITLPDGSTGPIVSVSGGLLDSATDLPFVCTAQIGKVNR